MPNSLNFSKSKLCAAGLKLVLASGAFWLIQITSLPSMDKIKANSVATAPEPTMATRLPSGGACVNSSSLVRIL